MQSKPISKEVLRSSKFLHEQMLYLKQNHSLEFERHVAYCPFHTETKPSFSQYIDNNGVVRFKCFGCQVNEDIFGVIIRLSKGKLKFEGAVSALRTFIAFSCPGRLSGNC